MAMKDDAIQFELPYNIQVCSSRLRVIAGQLKAQIGPLEGMNDGLIEEHSDVEVYMEGKNLFGSLSSGKYWIVHIYVNDMGESCQVLLNAVGHSTLQRLTIGGKNAYSFKRAVEKRDQIAQMLKQ